VWPKFKGYAYAQVRKMRSKQPQGKRKKSREEYGYDIKFAYHVVRLLNEVEQILSEGDLDLERNREQLKSIRAGDWTQEKVENYFERKELELESLYTQSELPPRPDMERLKQLLLNCLEIHYGSLDSCLLQQGELESAFRDIDLIMDKVRKLL